MILFRTKTQQEKEEHREMQKQIVKSSLTSAAIVSFLVMLFELFFYVNSIRHPRSFGALGVWYRACYMTLLVSSAVGFLLVQYIRTHYEKKYWIMLILGPIYSVIFSTWSLAVTYLDCLKSAKCSPILFMTVMICIPTCMYIQPLFYVVLDLAASGIMLWMTIYAPGGGDTADILNFFVYAVIQVIVSMFLLFNRYSYFKSVRAGLLNEQKARKAVEAKAATLSSMSHELRTPLNAILGMNELISRTDEQGELNEYTESIRVAGDSLLGLVNDMLDFSKLEAGKMKLNESAYNLSELMDRVYNIMHVLAENKGLTFRIRVEQRTPEILYGDGQKLQQLLINLINNAVKYTKEGSVVLEVSVDRGSPDKLCVTVADTGIGIRQEDIPFLFDSFSQVDDEYNHRIEGTGLGLMICERIVHLMQGEIGVESEFGKGSEFWFSVPQRIVDGTPIERLVWEELHTDSESKAKAVTEPKEGNAGAYTTAEDIRSEAVQAEATVAETKAMPRILVVDDTAMNLILFTKFLEKEPVLVDTAESGARCLEMVADQKYDMIFLDHLMPEMDGVETLKRLRESGIEWCKTVKVVALTANGGDEARQEYLELGFDEYLAKPIALPLLLEMVASLSM